MSRARTNDGLSYIESDKPIQDERDNIVKQKFLQLGSPYNLLSRLMDGNTRESAVRSENYSLSQRDFANLSMYSLITLIRSFNLKEIFSIQSLSADDLTDLVVSETEINAVEELYKKTAEHRLWIAQQTSNIDEISKSKYIYRSSRLMEQTVTPLNQEDGKYSHYISASYSMNMLSLSSCIKLLDITPEMLDKTIGLGMFMHGSHIMGNYRGGDSQDLSQRINRVDYITALAMKKSLLANQSGDKDKALKYAMVFGVLRGYNLRSEIGACWAQEMSLRCLLDAIDCHQPCKAAKFYLDIAACCEPMFGGQGNELASLLDNVMDEYYEPKGKIFVLSEEATEDLFVEFSALMVRYNLTAEQEMQNVGSMFR